MNQRTTVKLIVYSIGLAVAVTAGFFARGLTSSGETPSAMTQTEQMPLPTVVAQALKETPLDPLDEYIASVEPIQVVTVKPEVAGYIDQVHFTEGAFVEKGQMLFTIDQRRYRATVQVRQAELSRAQAELERASKYLKRLQSASNRSVSESDLESAESAQLQAKAALRQAEANLNLAQIDLDFCQIHAPISGRIGAALVTKGNYVTPGSGNLAKIVQMDPVRVVFSMTDRAFLSLRQREAAGTAQNLVARLRLPNGSIHASVGKKKFSNNEMSPETGTIALRFLFDNPDGMLIPGSYVNIMLGRSEQIMGIRVPQQALLLDSQGTYVLTANEKGILNISRIEVGKTIGTDIEVLSGLKGGDRVVIEGMQKVRPGTMANVTLQEAKQ
jgi:RND family efflux transporter MFP subunit